MFVEFLFFMAAIGLPTFAAIFAYFYWPAVIRTKPRSPGAMLAHTMLHPTTRGDWRISGKSDDGEAVNDKLGVRVSWHWYRGISAGFPLSWADKRKLDYGLDRLWRAKMKRDKMAGLVRTVEQMERAYMGDHA